MKIKFYPQKSDDSLSININQGLIEVNGVSYDLSPLHNYASIQLPNFTAAKIDNELVFSFALPYPDEPTIDVMQVYELEVDDSFNGPIDVPGHEYVQPEEITEGVINWPTPTPIEERRKAKWSEVESYRNNLMQTGGFPVGSYWFHSDLLSRSQQLGLIELGKLALANGVDTNDPIPNSPPWRTMSGEYITLTPTLTQSLVPSFLVQEASIFAVGDFYRNLINNSDNPEYIDITVGWPLTYKDTLI